MLFNPLTQPMRDLGYLLIDLTMVKWLFNHVIDAYLYAESSTLGITRAFKMPGLILNDVKGTAH